MGAVRQCAVALLVVAVAALGCLVGLPRQDVDRFAVSVLTSLPAPARKALVKAGVLVASTDVGLDVQAPSESVTGSEVEPKEGIVHGEASISASPQPTRGPKRSLVCTKAWYAESEDAHCVCASKSKNPYHGSWLDGLERLGADGMVAHPLSMEEMVEVLRTAAVPPTSHPQEDAPSPLRHVLEPSSASARMTDDSRCLRLGPAPCPPTLLVGGAVTPEGAVAHALRSTMPTVMRGAVSPAQGSNLVDSLGLWGGQRRGVSLTGARAQQHPVFVLRQHGEEEGGEEDGPPRQSRSLLLPWEAPDPPAPLPRPASVQEVAWPQEGQWGYHAGAVEEWGDAGGMGETLEELRATFAVPSGDDNSTGPTLRTWTAAAGVTASTHYDQVHNFFTQVQGFKRVVLYPPTAAGELHPFPSLHPSYHQAQLTPLQTGPLDDVASAALSVFTAAATAFNTSAAMGVDAGPWQRAIAAQLLAHRRAAVAARGPTAPPPKACEAACCSLGGKTMPPAADAPGAPQGDGEPDIGALYGSHLALEVVLGPGDTLYIPPMWLHRITALSPSQSLSVVSPSAADRVAGQVMWTRLPLEGVLHNPAARVLTAQALLARVFDLLQPYASADSSFAPHAHPGSTTPGAVQGGAAARASVSETGVTLPSGSLSSEDADVQSEARTRVSDEAGRLLLARWLPLYARATHAQRSLRRLLKGAAGRRGAVPPALRLLQGIRAPSLTCPPEGGGVGSDFSCFRGSGGVGQAVGQRPLSPAQGALAETVANVTAKLPALHQAAEEVADWLTGAHAVGRGETPPTPPLDWFNKAHWEALRFEHSAAGMVTGTALGDILGGSHASLSPGQVRILMWDYAEALGQWAMGDCGVPAFLRECLWRQDGWFPAGSVVAAAG